MINSPSFTSILALLLCFCLIKGDKPNIVVILADDLGWNDVSYHGSDQIPTPHMDKLAKEGIILNNYYVQPLCTPSRAAFMTGRYPIHTGMQEGTIFAANAWGLGLKETLLPELLKEQGYVTHGIGKWHLGFYAKDFLPTRRGFDTFYGGYAGFADFWDHSIHRRYWGLDLHNNEEPVHTQWGNYSTEMFTAEAEDRIRNHDKTQPMFLYLSYQAVHSANTQDPMQAPQDWIKKYSHIEHEGRRKYAAMVGYMDHGIGRVYDALVEAGMMDNTIFMFTSDNGGPANGYNFNWACNYPLRGVKALLWEGGVRAAGFVYSKLFEKQGRTSMDLMHITDWFPTLLKAAGGTPKDNLDGVDQWETLSKGEKSPRTEILLNIDAGTWRNQALRSGDWKIIQEIGLGDEWYPPPETEGTDSVIECGEKPEKVSKCTSPNFCLFNINDDPCEYNDLSEEHPEILNDLVAKLESYRKSAVPRRLNTTLDPLSDPKRHNGVWVPWRDEPLPECEDKSPDWVYK